MIDEYHYKLFYQQRCILAWKIFPSLVSPINWRKEMLKNTLRLECFFALHQQSKRVTAVKCPLCKATGGLRRLEPQNHQHRRKLKGAAF